MYWKRPCWSQNSCVLVKDRFVLPQCCYGRCTVPRLSYRDMQQHGSTQLDKILSSSWAVIMAPLARYPLCRWNLPMVKAPPVLSCLTAPPLALHWLLSVFCPSQGPMSVLEPRRISLPSAQLCPRLLLRSVPSVTLHQLPAALWKSGSCLHLLPQVSSSTGPASSWQHLWWKRGQGWSTGLGVPGVWNKLIWKK